MNEEQQQAERITVQVSIESFDTITAIASVRALTTDEAADFLIRLGQSRFGALAHYAESHGLGMPGTGRRRTVRAVGASIPVKKKGRKKKTKRRTKKAPLALLPSDAALDGNVSIGEPEPVKSKRKRAAKLESIAADVDVSVGGALLEPTPPSMLNGSTEA
jgi:hypothetical protein